MHHSLSFFLKKYLCKKNTKIEFLTFCDQFIRTMALSGSVRLIIDSGHVLRAHSG